MFLCGKEGSYALWFVMATAASRCLHASRVGSARSPFPRRSCCTRASYSSDSTSRRRSAPVLAPFALAILLAAAAVEPAGAVLNSPVAKQARSAEAALRRSIPAFNPFVGSIQQKVENVAFLLRIPQRKPWGSMTSDVQDALVSTLCQLYGFWLHYRQFYKSRTRFLLLSPSKGRLLGRCMLPSCLSPAVRDRSCDPTAFASNKSSELHHIATVLDNSLAGHSEEEPRCSSRWCARGEQRTTERCPCSPYGVCLNSFSHCARLSTESVASCSSGAFHWIPA